MPWTLREGIVEGTEVLTHAKPDADPIPQKFPVIFFIPGMGAERQKHTILCEELASQGYVVLCLDQPYFSNFVKFPDGRTYVLSFKDAWNLKDRDYRYAYYDEAMAGSMADIKYMMGHLNEIDESLSDVLDKNRIILMGHSFGGNVADTLGFEDSRVKAVVDIDSKITERAVFGRVGIPPNSQGKPVLLIRAMMQYQPDDIEDQLAKIENATLWLPQVQHSAFTDQAYLAANTPDFGVHGNSYRFLHWLFKRGPHFDRVDTDLGEHEPDAWFSEYRHYIVDWLGKTLDNQSKAKVTRSPLGDNQNTEVYSFIVDQLNKAKSYSPEEISALMEQEQKILEDQSTDKPHMADISEGELAHLLGVFCRDFPGCQEITLYQKDGMGIALGSIDTELKFKEQGDPLLKRGILGVNPLEFLGTRILTGLDGGTYSEITKAILYDPEGNRGYLSSEALPEGHQLIGFVRYIVG